MYLITDREALAAHARDVIRPAATVCMGGPPEEVTIRVLMLTPDEGNLDRRIAQEAASLAKRGWQTDLVSTVDPALQYEGQLAHGVSLATFGSGRRGDGPGKRMLRGVKRRIVHLAPAIGRTIEATQYRLRDISAEILTVNLPRLMRGGPYDLVFAHDIPVLPLAVQLKRRWGSALICDLHEIFPEQTAWITSARGREYWRSIERRFLAECDAILAVNEGVADYVRAEYGITRPVAIVQNSLPFMDRASLTRRNVRSYYPIRPGDRVMIWAGTLRAQTNLETVIRGFSRSHLDGWALAVLGSGPLLPALQRLVQEERAVGRVFLGRRAPQDDLVPLAASADVGLLPYQAESINLLVATPNKLYEYMQARVPIATSALPQVERIVNVHGNGRIVDYSTTETTSRGLRSFVEDALPSITTHSLEAAAREFSWENDERALFETVDQALMGRGH